jgi:hypothetical protein
VAQFVVFAHNTVTGIFYDGAPFVVQITVK